MGEQTVVTMTTKTINDLGRVLGRELAKALAATEPAPPAPAETDIAPRALDVEPWQIFDPRRQCVVVAYVDDANQQRWVSIAEEVGVPKAWRKIYVEQRAA
jgi:hypothetical protein